MNTAARGLDRRLDEGRGKFVLAEDRLERGLPGHDRFDGLGLDRQHDVGAHARRRGRLVPAPARRGQHGRRGEHGNRRA